MNPDPVAKLAQFTPAPSVDAAELLFAAGRASARTHWLWKTAVAVLVVSNAALGAWIALRSNERPEVPRPDPIPVVRPVPAVPAKPQAAPPASSAPDEEQWSYRSLRGSDFERPPSPVSLATAAPHAPLTVLSGRRGEID
jgi:hypothetical protein